MTRDSQNTRILKHLKRYRRITQTQALRQHGVLRLASRINELRRDGCNITTETIEVRTRNGKARVARYLLNTVKP